MHEFEIFPSFFGRIRFDVAIFANGYNVLSGSNPTVYPLYVHKCAFIWGCLARKKRLLTLTEAI